MVAPVTGDRGARLIWASTAGLAVLALATFYVSFRAQYTFMLAVNLAPVAAHAGHPVDQPGRPPRGRAPDLGPRLAHDDSPVCPAVGYHHPPSLGSGPQGQHQGPDHHPGPGRAAGPGRLGQRIGRATQALSNGYCGLPVVKTCPHANACGTQSWSFALAA